MSDSLPENSFSGILRVVKLLTGEEIAGLVSDSMPDKIAIKFPAKLENYMGKDSKGNPIEFVKLTNYAASTKSFEISLNKSAIVFVAQPSAELEKMYEIYFMAVQTDPKSIQNSMPEGMVDVDTGLQLLNDLFTNEDFVNFVNDLMDTYEGVEILADLGEDVGDEDVGDEDEEEPESSRTGTIEEEPEPPSKKKKRSIMKPESTKMPYKPENPPEDPKSWSDNPMDYM
jgi:hypothetical protein